MFKKKGKAYARSIENIDALLQDSLAAAKVGCWQFNLQTQEQQWTPELYRIFEIQEPQPETTLHSVYLSRVHPDDLHILEKAINGANLGKDFDIQHRIVVKDGSTIRHVRGRGRVTLDDAGRPLLISGTCQDITSQVLQEHESQLILNTLGIGIWKYNPLTQDLKWDRSMYELFEIQECDFNGHYHAWESSLTPESKATAIAELGLALEGKKEFNTTFTIRTKTGTKAIGGKGHVVRNPDGKAIFMYGINWDRSKEVADEELIVHQQRLLSTVLDHLPSMVFAKDYGNGGRFSLFNKAGETLLGVPAANVLGKRDHDILPSDQADFFVQKDMEVFLNKAPFRIDREPIQTPMGTRILRTHKVPTYDSDGKPALLIGISTDITDEIELQRGLEQERAKSLHTSKLASLGEMSAGIAHEINNPLSIICLSVPLLRKFKDNPEMFDKKISSIEMAVFRIEKIVSGLRKFSRSSQSSEQVPENIANLIQESLVLTEAKAKRYYVEIRTDLATSSLILCDGVEIEQVIVNLINNGIDAVQNFPERWLEIKAFDDSQSVVVQITDSGHGLSEDVEKRIFEPFFTTKPVGQGTGLGLSISKGILDHHGATIALNRESAHTCFEIRFPRHQEARRAA
jgi:PAS domain S-box-containing protein